MKKMIVMLFTLLSLVAALAGAGTKGTWTGWVTDEHCGAKGASADHKACAEKCLKDGSKLVDEAGQTMGLIVTSIRQVADIMGVTPGRVSQIENGDLDVNEVATLSRYAQALGARMRIIFDYGDDLRQIA